MKVRWRNLLRPPPSASGRRICHSQSRYAIIKHKFISFNENKIIQGKHHVILKLERYKTASFNDHPSILWNSQIIKFLMSKDVKMWLISKQSTSITSGKSVLSAKKRGCREWMAIGQRSGNDGSSLVKTSQQDVSSGPDGIVTIRMEGAFLVKINFGE